MGFFFEMLKRFANAKRFIKINIYNIYHCIQFIKTVNKK